MQKNLKFKIAIPLIAILCCLLLSEVLLHAVYRLRSDIWLWQNEKFAVDFTSPVNDRREFHLRPGFKDQRMSINKSGYRNPFKNQKNIPKIICAGDSVPFGYMLPDNYSYPAILGEFLNQVGISMDVINAGVPSYNFRQSYDLIRLDVLPDFENIKVITLQAANDLSLLTHYREKYTPELTWASLRYSHSWPAHWLYKSALLWHLDQAINKISGKKENPLKKEKHRPFNDELMIKSLKDTLEKLTELLKQKDIPLILLPVDPYYYKDGKNPESRALPQFKSYENLGRIWHSIIVDINNELKSFAENHKNVYYLDLREYFDQYGRQGMFIDFIHYSPQGNIKVAEILLRFMNEKGMLPKKL